MKTLILAVVRSALLILTCFSPLVLAQSKPNIVLIVSDDLGYNDLSSYGSKEIKTPNIDSIARDGIKLMQAYANGSVCTPTRAALMTGRYQQRYGFDWVITNRDQEKGLSAKEPSLPRMLKNNGYVTGAFGKWHLGFKPEYSPNAHGFDEFFGFLASDLDYYSHRDSSGDLGLYENGQVIEKPGYLTDLISERAVSFIDQHKRTPFFLYVPFNAPHWPYQAPNRPQDIRDKNTYGPRNGNRADYIQMVQQMDFGVGRILQALENAGVAKNTLVIFTNDNGGERFSDNSPFFHGKYTVWEGGIRVPCLMKWPGNLPKGTVSNQPLITMDITATLLSVAGVTQALSPNLDGLNLMPILAGKQQPIERTFFWRMAAAQGGQKAARRGKWKYVRDTVELLFDLENDPAERVNLSYRNPDKLLEMRQAVDEWEKEIKASSGN